MTPNKLTTRLLAALLPAALIACGSGGSSSSGTTSTPFSASVARQIDDIAVQVASAYAASLAFDVCSACLSRDYAIAYVAAHDTLNGIKRSYEPLVYSGLSQPDAEPNAAVAAAMRAVFRATLPEQSGIYEPAFTALLAAIADGSAKSKGIALGEAVAQAVLASRGSDGASADNTLPAGYVQPDSVPAGAGVYALTSGATQLAVPGWGKVAPFAITSAAGYVSQLSAPYGGSFGSDFGGTAYATDLAEVRCIGSTLAAPSGCATLRASGDDAKARFWFENSPTMWNRIAAIAATNAGLDGAARIRLHALVNVAIADSLIVSYAAQYQFNLWRPETAVRYANLAGGTADTSWQPLGYSDSDHRTPASPGYPATDVTAAGAAQAVLDSVFAAGARSFAATSTSASGTRSFADFAAAAREAADAQVLLGFNFRAGVEDGLVIGRRVGADIVASKMRAVAQ
ncbi:phosphatase PAP2 family protein [Derxia lacustris]|uniref:hypothetical protein n=1 Tax=Derxia lacustris TaxID=764842 RepID=UPI000A17844E|nr:hypothetical protein [Derxia lacustris]